MGLEINPSKCSLLAKHLDLNEVKEQSLIAVQYDGKPAPVQAPDDVHHKVPKTVKNFEKESKAQGLKVRAYG